MRGLPAAAAALLIGLIGLSGSTALAQPTTSPTTTPFTTPNTDNCPNKTKPPPPIDESEVPQPGQSTPDPLPVPATPVGGDDLGGCGVITPDGAGTVPKEISATAWAVSDLDSGQVLAAKDPHGRYRPASTIKVLLSIVALRELDLRKTVTGTYEDAEVDGTRVGIGPGGKYTNLQLMQALVMASGNDAAHAIAAQLGGDTATVAKMNDEAKALGALDTRAATPSGLDGPGMSTSAYDLSLIFREAMRNRTFAQLIHTEQVQFPGFPPDPRIKDDKDHPSFPIGNDNHLLYNYDGAIGGKTGFTDDARQTFVAGAQRNGRNLVVTLLKADVEPIRPWEQAARLLDYGFALDREQSVGQLVSAADADGPATRTGPDSVTLAAPPGGSARTTPVTDDGLSGAARILLVLGGLLIVCLLLLAADGLRSRHRRR